MLFNHEPEDGPLKVVDNKTFWQQMLDNAMSWFRGSVTFAPSNKDRDGNTTYVTWQDNTRIHHARGTAPQLDDGSDLEMNFGLWSGAVLEDADAYTDWDELDRIHYGEDGE